MNKKSKNKLIWVAIIVVIIGIFSYAMYQDSIPGKYDDFTKCLKDKGAIFYGAFWCPHCQKQKSLFGKSKKYLVVSNVDFRRLISRDRRAFLGNSRGENRMRSISINYGF